MCYKEDKSVAHRPGNYLTQRRESWPPRVYLISYPHKRVMRWALLCSSLSYLVRVHCRPQVSCLWHTARAVLHGALHWIILTNTYAQSTYIYVHTGAAWGSVLDPTCWFLPGHYLQLLEPSSHSISKPSVPFQDPHWFWGHLTWSEDRGSRYKTEASRCLGCAIVDIKEQILQLKTRDCANHSVRTNSATHLPVLSWPRSDQGRDFVAQDLSTRNVLQDLLCVCVCFPVSSSTSEERTRLPESSKANLQTD